MFSKFTGNHLQHHFNPLHVGLQAFWLPVGIATLGLTPQMYSGNLGSTDRKSLPVADDNAPYAKGEVQSHPHSKLNLPLEASPGGCLAGATGTGGNRPKTITSFYLSCYKAIRPW